MRLQISGPRADWPWQNYKVYLKVVANIYTLGNFNQKFQELWFLV